MCWNLTISPNKALMVSHTRAYHLSKVALDASSLSSNEDIVQLWIKKGDNECLISNLSIVHPQDNLDLAFDADETIEFCCIGNGILYISGYYIPADEYPLLNVEAEKMDQDQKTDGSDRAESINNLITTDLLENESTVPENIEKELDNGVIVKDTVRGKGKKIKVGDTVTIYYVNRLETNAIVGRLQTGDGLKFKLGDQSETTIGGWHIGIIGMRKKGVRTILCPPESAYGEKGIPPFVPPNSTIHSDVSVLAVERAKENIGEPDMES